jgi:hypothetical protein
VALRLDDLTIDHLLVPPGCCMGIQALTEAVALSATASTARIKPPRNLAVRHDDSTWR